GDKDFYQLVRTGIKVFNPKEEGTWYDAEGVNDKFGVPPELVVDVLALMGDTIDNIKGVPGIGEKGARELIVQYGSLENLIAHAGEVKNKRYREGLLASVDRRARLLHRAARRRLRARRPPVAPQHAGARGGARARCAAAAARGRRRREGGPRSQVRRDRARAARRDASRARDRHDARELP